MTSALGTLIRHLRRRHLVNLLLDQATVAATMAMGALIVLLLVGTQILDWYWLVLVFAGSLGIGLYRVRRRMLTHYEVAQRADERLGSHDLLSTAWYFSNGGHAAKTEPEMLGRLRDAAESFALTADAGTASPMTLPRMAWAGLALTGIALGLFGIRYGIRRSLDLSSPLVAVHLDSLFTPKPQLAAERKSAVQKHLEDQIRALGVNTDEMPDAAGENAEVKVPVTQDEPSEGDKPMLSKDNRTKGMEQISSPEQGSEGEGEDPSQGPKDGKEREGSSESTDQGGPAGKPSAPPPDAKQGKNQSGENSNLMDKMRDAMANLLQKLKMQPKSGSQQQMASNQPPKSGGKMEQSGQKGQQSQDKSQAQGQPNADPNGEQQGEGGDPSQAEKQGEQGSERPGQQDSKSGIGKQDGDKDIRDAQQLAAMGKISELIGKRSANLNGEVTVEVLSGKRQTLKTALSNQVATHVEAGGESNRDEIPLAYQQYVQQYFEQVRKAAAAQAKAKGAAN